jgi:hypothetical protein
MSLHRRVARLEDAYWTAFLDRETARLKRHWRHPGVAAVLAHIRTGPRPVPEAKFYALLAAVDEAERAAVAGDCPFPAPEAPPAAAGARG